MKFVKWITLTPAEREAVGGGSQRQSGIAYQFKEHCFTVMLPNGEECMVSYTRYAVRFHSLEFSAPLCQKIGYEGELSGIQAVEEKGKELAPQAFRMAQQDEQKQMRRKTPPQGVALKSIGEPQLRNQSAERQAGYYAVCIRHVSGTLVPKGVLYEDSDKACGELASGVHDRVQLHGEQKLVVGICCRYAKRWQEPKLLALPAKPPEPAESPKSPARRTRKTPQT